MKENIYTSGFKLSEEIKRQIDYILEEFRLEGISSLLFPGQLLAVLLVKNSGRFNSGAKEGNPFFRKNGIGEVKAEFERIKGKIVKGHSIYGIIHCINLISSQQILGDIWRLGTGLMNIYANLHHDLDEAVKLEKGHGIRQFEDVMNYMNESIRKGHRGKEFYVSYSLAMLLITLIDPGAGKIWVPFFGNGTMLLQTAKWAEDKSCNFQVVGEEDDQKLIDFVYTNALFYGVPMECLTLTRTSSGSGFSVVKDGPEYDYIFANGLSSITGSSRIKAFKTAAGYIRKWPFLGPVLDQIKKTERQLF